MGDVLAGKLAAYAFPDKAFTPGANGTGEIAEVGRVYTTSSSARRACHRMP